jgi:hypothetical protein
MRVALNDFDCPLNFGEMVYYIDRHTDLDPGVVSGKFVMRSESYPYTFTVWSTNYRGREVLVELKCDELWVEHAEAEKALADGLRRRISSMQSDLRSLERSYRILIGEEQRELD